MPCVPGWLAHSGRSTSHGSFWAFERRPSRSLSPSLVSSSPPRSLMYSSSFSSCVRCSPFLPAHFLHRLLSSLLRRCSPRSSCTCGAGPRPRLSRLSTRGPMKLSSADPNSSGFALAAASSRYQWTASSPTWGPRPRLLLSLHAGVVPRLYVTAVLSPRSSLGGGHVEASLRRVNPPT
jgi:hypothetical protein